MLKLIAGILLVSFLFSGCEKLKGTPPATTELGLQLQAIGDRRGYALRPCPTSGNCVASYEKLNEPKNFLRPIDYSEPKDVAFDKILKIILKTPGFSLVKQSQDYFYGEAKTMFGLFVDDIELDLREKGVIHFRSSSRVLPFDFGSNKRRIEEWRFKFHQNDI